MRKPRILTGLLAALSLMWAGSAVAEPLRTAHVESELISSRAAIEPGERFTIALRQRIVDGWHVYWTNPGDSGEPVRFTWTTPRGFEIGAPRHPAPDVETLDIITTYVHRGEIYYPIEVTAPANLRPGQSVTLRAGLVILVCSTICLKEEGQVELTLPVAATGSPDQTWAPRIDDAIARLPQDAPLDARITPGDPARLTVSGAPLQNLGELRKLRFFPFSQDAIRHNDPQNPSYGDRGVSFALTPGIAGPLGQSELAGVISFERRTPDGWRQHSYNIRATPGEALPGVTGQTPNDGTGAGAEFEPQSAPDFSLAAIPLELIFAFIGGLILNIMPCVLPVLAMKAVGLAQGAQEGRARRDGLFYFAGVLTTFLALAAILVALRGAGEAAGWAFQLQQPWMVAALALLFFAIGLNFIGAYELNLPTGLGQSLTEKGGDAGAFFTGALAVVAASPCLGPFLPTAVFFALAAPPPVTLLVFAAIAIGFALPILLLSFAPALRRLVPKPGPWMIRFRQVLGFAMFAAAVWLAWVLTVQTGAMGALALLSLAVLLGFIVLTLKWGRVWLGIAAALFIGAGVFLWSPLTTPAANPSASARSEALAFEPWSVERVNALRQQNRPVFVNFTAAWCMQCLVNDATTLRSPRVAEAFEKANVAYLKADWTNTDDSIAAEIDRHGRAGIPLYLYYAPGADRPEILPPNLSEADILNAVERGAHIEGAAR